jgi:RNA polymerase sigma-70 factor (ECF subfamily)
MVAMTDAPNSQGPPLDGSTVERFRTVMLPHLDAAYGFARWLTRDPVVAQDVAQEAMLRALRYFHAFRGEEARPWLMRIVRNTWHDVRTRRGSNDESLEVVEHRPADGPDPEQSALGADRRRHVAAALAALPVDLREVLVLREIEDLSYK